MQNIEFDNIKSKLDEDGFLKNPSDWNGNIALALAASIGIYVLSESHWKIINYLHKYCKENGIAPLIRTLCKDTGFKLMEIYELFPKNHLIDAYKISGFKLPKRCL